MKSHLILFFVFLTTQYCYAQPQTNNWFFSRNKGLSFATGVPVLIPGGQIVQYEGTATISDKNGKLLFYTDGVAVWNRQHKQMPNGFGLNRGYGGSSTQSSLIVPKGADEKQYYIFTADQEGDPAGFGYSVVDMSADNGNGDVVVKDVQLVTPVAEKVTAVLHCNKKDYWVITHKFGSDEFYTYLATATGVNPVPVISKVGSFVPDRNGTMAGALKSSPDGKKIVSMQPQYGVELFDFDNQTGVLSNGVEISQNGNSLPYSAEFSVDSKMLYAAITGYWYEPDLKRYSGVFQFDLSLPTVTDIINSRIEVFRYDKEYVEMGIMQRGPDNKIYMAKFEKQHLAVINNPSVKGAGCNFVDLGLDVGGTTYFCLPYFINEYISNTADSFIVKSNSYCVNVPIEFEYKMKAGVTGVRWNFGDPASGISNESTQLTPSHTFSDSGSYEIKLITYTACGSDTLKKKINVDAVFVKLGNDTSFCDQSRLLLQPSVSGSNRFLWQDGSSSASYTASAPGVYWVDVTSAISGCSNRDSINLTSIPLPVVKLGSDTSLCVGNSLILNAANPGAVFTWKDNSVEQTYTVTTSGSYWVKVTENGCTAADTINVSTITKPQFSLGQDQYLCPGLTLTLSPGLNAVDYRWQDGSQNPEFIVQRNGIYSVDITNQCGTSSDTITILQGNCTVYVPNAFSPNKDGVNDYFSVSGTGLVELFELQIYNRFGELIYRTTDKNGKWDGTFAGKDVSVGMYVYQLKIKEIGAASMIVQKGNVWVLR